eukprot:SAG11_NODE_7146_length_1187_cov_0.659926_1_plen_207_part_10
MQADHCEKLVDEKFEFYECYQFCAELCLVRIHTLSRGRFDAERDVESEITDCRKILCQLVMYLYYEPDGPKHRVELFNKEIRETLSFGQVFNWPRQGITKSLDLLPPFYQQNHHNDVAKWRDQTPAQIAEQCAKICRSQILANIFRPKVAPMDTFKELHHELFKWFITQGFQGTSVTDENTPSLPALRPGLFDIQDYDGNGTEDKCV